MKASPMYLQAKLEDTYTPRFYADRVAVLQALAPLYGKLRRRYTRSQVQHLLIEALDAVRIYETMFKEPPAKAITAAAAATYGRQPAAAHRRARNR